MARKTAPHMKKTTPSGKVKSSFRVDVNHYDGRGPAKRTTHTGFFANKTEARSHFQNRFPLAHSVSVTPRGGPKVTGNLRSGYKKVSGQDSKVLGQAGKCGGHAGHGK